MDVVQIASQRSKTARPEFNDSGRSHWTMQRNGPDSTEADACFGSHQVFQGWHGDQSADRAAAEVIEEHFGLSSLGG